MPLKVISGFTSAVPIVVPLISTLEVEVKPVPVIMTIVPAGPEVGAKPVIGPSAMLTEDKRILSLFTKEFENTVVEIKISITKRSPLFREGI